MDELNNNWKAIPGWPEYLINEAGQVKRVEPSMGVTVGKILRPQLQPNGYLKISLCRNAKRKEYLLHRLVAMTFIGDPTGKDVCHEDGNRSNNHASNLRIDTRKGNMADAIRHGTTPRGERCGSNKHSRETVQKVKRLLADGQSMASVSRQFSIPMSTIQGIKEKKIWGWLHDF